MKAPIKAFFDQTDLEHSLLIGYYGGGNYGDELLLEVIANLLQKNQVRAVTVTYQKPRTYQTFHHDFGYARLPMSDKKQLFQAMLKNKNIVIGGGGLWGMDVNFNIFVLGVLLLVMRFIFRKKVYLIGVGYYNSTSKLGHISAWLAGKSARHIIARDDETFQNFQKVSRHVSLDQDLAWHLSRLDLKPYQPDLKKLNKTLPITKKTLFITLRRFRPHQQNHYLELVQQCIANNPDKPIIVSLMEPKAVDPAGYKLIRSWQKKYSHIRAVDFSYNPLALYLFFQKHHKKLVLIAPQFHTILTAHLCDVPFLPIAYDNKVMELFSQLKTKHAVPIRSLTGRDMQHFVDTSF